LIVYGCISKVITDRDVKQLLRILVKALESFTDTTLIDAIVMCLTRVLPLLRPESPIHPAVFWVAISVLQLDEVSLYASGLALLEQNLHTLDSQVRNFFSTPQQLLHTIVQLLFHSQGLFESRSLEQVIMAAREPLEWHFKQLDHTVGLSFKVQNSSLFLALNHCSLIM
jgi:neurofibromin 1